MASDMDRDDRIPRLLPALCAEMGYVGTHDQPVAASNSVFREHSAIAQIISAAIEAGVIKPDETMGS